MHKTRINKSYTLIHACVKCAARVRLICYMNDPKKKSWSHTLTTTTTIKACRCWEEGGIISQDAVWVWSAGWKKKTSERQATCRDRRPSLSTICRIQIDDNNVKNGSLRWFLWMYVFIALLFFLFLCFVDCCFIHLFRCFHHHVFK